MKNSSNIGRRTFSAIALSALALTTTAAYAQEFTARIGHLESPQQSRHIHLEKVAELVKERTGGAVEFQIFPQAQLGNQRVMTEGVQLGTLEATVSPAAFLGRFQLSSFSFGHPLLDACRHGRSSSSARGPIR